MLQKQEPTVIVVLTPKGLEKAFVLYQEDDPDAFEAGTLLLAQIATHLTLIDNALRGTNDSSKE